MNRLYTLSRNALAILSMALLASLIGCAEWQSPELQETTGDQSETSDEATSDTSEAPSQASDEDSGSQSRTESAESSANQQNQEGGGSDTSFSDVKQEVGEAAQATKEYSAKQMKELRATLQDQFEQLDENYENLKEQGQDLAGDAKQQWEEQMARLKEQRQEIQNDLQKLGEASGSAWQELRTGINNALDEFKASMNTISEKQQSDSSGNNSGN